MNLSLEHTQFLGDTLAKIAFEKSGIIKSGCPVVTYPVEREAETVYQAVCDERGAVWHRADMDSVLLMPAEENTRSDLDKMSGQMFSWHGYKNMKTSLKSKNPTPSVFLPEMMNYFISKIHLINYSVTKKVKSQSAF